MSRAAQTSDVWADVKRLKWTWKYFWMFVFKLPMRTEQEVWLLPIVHKQKPTTVGVVDPAERDGSFLVALAEAEQEGPRLFSPQQLICFLPAHEPHDVPETHTGTTWQPVRQLRSKVTWTEISLSTWLLSEDDVIIIHNDTLRCVLPVTPKIHQVFLDQIQDSIDPNPGTFILTSRKAKGNM